MTVIAHLTLQEMPLWVAILVAGVGLGIAISLAVVGYLCRRN
jgi:hypothetical protein